MVTLHYSNRRPLNPKGKYKKKKGEIEILTPFWRRKGASNVDSTKKLQWKGLAVGTSVSTRVMVLFGRG